MTLLGATVDGGQILAAADGRGIRTDAYSDASSSHSVSKLRYPGTLPLVWGYRGVEEVGERVAYAVEEKDPATFPEFAVALAQSLRRENMLADASNREHTEVLLAGFHHEYPIVSHITWHGVASGHPKICFVGTGWVSAYTAWDALEAATPAMSAEQRLTIAMRATIARVEPLGEPLNLWRITQTTVTSVF